MISKINIRNSLIAIMSITIVFMSIGFILISMRLEKYRNDEVLFQVDFARVRLINSIKGGSKDPKGELDITLNNKVIDMNFDLYSENDELDYEIVVKNNGNVSAKIVDIMMSPDYVGDYKSKISPIDIDMSDISGKKLEPGEETAFKLSVVYNAGSVKGSRNITGKLGLIAETD